LLFFFPNSTKDKVRQPFFPLSKPIAFVRVTAGLSFFLTPETAAPFFFSGRQRVQNPPGTRDLVFLSVLGFFFFFFFPMGFALPAAATRIVFSLMIPR